MRHFQFGRQAVRIDHKAMILAGNFNLVNTDELFSIVNIEPGTFQKQSDLAAMMEVVHHFIVKEDEAHPGALSLSSVLKKAFKHFDGGYHVSGLLGNGDSFVVRDDGYGHHERRRSNLLKRVK